MRTIRDLMRMEGRVAVVTGGAGYLGLAFGEALVEQGARVVVVDLDAAACAERADALSKTGVACLGVAIDLADPSSANEIVQRAKERFGRLDIVVHNAALTGASSVSGYAVPFDEQSLEAWNLAIQVNLTPAFRLVQEARPLLEQHGVGSVINVSSIYGVVGPNMNLYGGTAMGNPAAYAATKGALISLTRYLATVLAPRIRVNALVPGGIERAQPVAFSERYVGLTPLARMGREEDFKGALAYLASDASSWVTGQVLAVDGGWTAW
jgi:NAD(P)-dependent dehydrogenase (short-subunit alcohol dehydrogenase family)